MKTIVITAYDVSTARKAGQTSIVVPDGALITPQAADDARGYGIALERAGQCGASQAMPVAGRPTAQAASSVIDEVRRQVAAKLGNADPASLDAVISAVMAAYPVSGAVPASSGAPFIRNAGAVTQVSAADLPRQGNMAASPAAVSMVETVQSVGAHPGLGYMSWENSSFDWTFRHAEVLVVLEGEIALATGGAVLSGKTGDSFVIPEQSAVTLSAKGRARCVHAFWSNPETAKG